MYIPYNMLDCNVHLKGKNFILVKYKLKHEKIERQMLFIGINHRYLY